MTTRSKERPILMSGPLVRATLEGRKTQARRPVKWQPLRPGLNLNFSALSVGEYFTGHPETGYVLRGRDGACWSDRTKPACCPFGVPGDRLWVRETWADEYGSPDDYPRVVFRADRAAFDYSSHNDRSQVYFLPSYYQPTAKWTPSVHMPRWASRLLLEMTRVRVERLQSISEEDAKAEGVTAEPLVGDRDQYDCWDDGKHTTAFEYLWGKTYGFPGERDDGKDWRSNPWVWVIEYKVISTEGA